MTSIRFDIRKLKSFVAMTSLTDAWHLTQCTMCNKPNFRASLFILSVMGTGNALLHIAVQFSSVCRDTLEKKESGVQRYHDMEEEHPLEFEQYQRGIL